jgi:hypothetical protein
MIADEIRRWQAEGTNTGAVVEEVELVRSAVAAPAVQLLYRQKKLRDAW